MATVVMAIGPELVTLAKARQGDAGRQTYPFRDVDDHYIEPLKFLVLIERCPQNATAWMQCIIAMHHMSQLFPNMFWGVSNMLKRTQLIHFIEAATLGGFAGRSAAFVISTLMTTILQRCRALRVKKKSSCRIEFADV